MREDQAMPYMLGLHHEYLEADVGLYEAGSSGA